MRKRNALDVIGLEGDGETGFGYVGTRIVCSSEKVEYVMKRLSLISMSVLHPLPILSSPMHTYK